MESKSFWSRKYRKNIAKMIGICYRYVMDRQLAEDLAHDAFIKAMEKSDSYSGIGSFDAWLTRIAVNTALMYLRSNSKMDIVRMDEEIECNQPDCEESAISDADTMMETIRKADFTQEEILEAIAQLPEHHRIVFNLYVFDHLTHKQIAELRGISVGTSKSHLARARNELQRILFEKTKHRKSMIMAIFFLYPFKGMSIDRWCHRQLSDFALEPTRDAVEFCNSAMAGQPVPKGLVVGKAAVAAGAALAVVGASVVINTREPASIEPSPVPEDSPVSVQDSTKHEILPLKVKTESRTLQNSQSPSTESQEDVALVESESPHPPKKTVVVKKVVETHRKTIVVLDTNQ